MQQIFLFGLPGVGKSYIGKLLEEKYNFLFWDGDQALSPEMKEYIRREEPFTSEMTAQLSSNIISTIHSLVEEEQRSKEGRPIAIAQAMLIEGDRQTIKEHFPDMQFIHVVSDKDIANKRIDQRNDWVSVSFAENIRSVFERIRGQTEKYPTLVNNSDGNLHIEQQLQFLLGLEASTAEQTALGTTSVTEAANVSLLAIKNFWNDMMAPVNRSEHLEDDSSMTNCIRR